MKTFWPAAILLILLGWGGLAAVISLTTPNGGTRWAFFFTATLALTGTALPFVAYLNQRFPSKPPPNAAVIVRQALELGLYLPILGWLQLGGVLSLFLALMIALGLAMIEFLLRLREKSLWQPEAPSEKTS